MCVYLWKGGVGWQGKLRQKNQWEREEREENGKNTGENIVWQVKIQWEGTDQEWMVQIKRNKKIFLRDNDDSANHC